MRFSDKENLFRNLLRKEHGATLVEELMTVAIISFGIVILVAMIYTGVVGVRLVDDKVVAESLARSQLEIIKDAAYDADPSSYPSVTGIPGYVVTVKIEFWDAASSFNPDPPDNGMQKITVTVSTGGDTLVQTVMFKVNR